MSIIENVYAREVLDSRGNPTVEVEVSLEDGQSLEVQVVEISDDSVVLDGNHPLAGKELHFEIALLAFS